ncbi:endonuclease/exonuclease/phosphatase family protein [Streptomyces sp. ventii]|uniref:Endonuclease/exonuclease/phosphatase family protein n=1 Tax=Streptomyces spiramenti TaxID=2720606 RepID=A0ABX1AH59_9ACTN|nr:endonuclease/exonuclease/phosphatase family protein [Streptomyces spiramenti]
MPAALALLTALLLAFPGSVPNAGPRLGSLLESFLPWLGLAVPVLLAAALLRRSALAVTAVLLPLAAWCAAFGHLLLPGPAPQPRELLVLQHNVSDENTDPVGTARAMAAAGPDLIGVQELLPEAVESYRRTLAPEYPHHAVSGTVALWSKHPLSDVAPLDIKPRDLTEPWNRGLRAVVTTPHGDVVAHVVHLPSMRVGAGGLTSQRRDESATLLGRAIAEEPLHTVILLGDLNGTTEDRGLAPLTDRLNVPERGFGFSFPVGLPVARIDQVMARTATVTDLRTLPATGSDHLPVTARILLP